MKIVVLHTLCVHVNPSCFRYNDLKERSRKKLDFYYDHNASFALNISISAPVLVIPDKANDATWSTAIVVDLGRLEIMSDQQLQQPTAANDVDKSESVTVFDAGDSIGVAASSLVDRHSGGGPKGGGGGVRASGAQNSYDEDAGEDTSSTGRSDDRPGAEHSGDDEDSEEEVGMYFLLRPLLRSVLGWSFFLC